LSLGNATLSHVRALVAANAAMVIYTDNVQALQHSTELQPYLPYILV
jgi:hypothetical protein